MFTGSYVPGPGGSGDFPYVQALRPGNSELHALRRGAGTALPRTSFLLTLRRYQDDGYLYGIRRFTPTDTSDFAQKAFRPTGDNEEIAMARLGGMVRLS